MSHMSRRSFLQTAMITASALTLKADLPFTGVNGGQWAALAKTPDHTIDTMTMVSDVDAHSQCRMKVHVKDGQVISVNGDPADPEGCGQLTLRGRHIRPIFYRCNRTSLIFVINSGGGCEEFDGVVPL